MTVLLIALISLAPLQRTEFNTMFHPQIVWDPETCLTAPPYNNTLEFADTPIVVCPNGQIHIVWFSFRPNTPQTPQVYYKRFVPDAGWTPDTCISADLALWERCGYPEIACDSQGNIHTVWGQYSEYTGYLLWYKMRRADGVWDSVSTLISVGSSTLPRGGVNISCAPDSSIHTIWREYYPHYGSWIVYREKVGGVWQSPLVLDSVGPDSALGSPSVLAGPDNRVHVVYYARDSSERRYAKLFYRCRTGTVWSPRELIHAGADTFTGELSTSIYRMRINPFTGEPHIIFYDGSLLGCHSYRSNGVWQPRETLGMRQGDTTRICMDFTFTRDGTGYALLYERIPPRTISFWYQERNRSGQWSPPYLARPGDSTHFSYGYSGFTSGGDGPNPNHLYFIWEMSDMNYVYQIYTLCMVRPARREWNGKRKHNPVSHHLKFTLPDELSST